MTPDTSQRFSEPQRAPGETRSPLDFDSPAHFYADRMSSKNSEVVFSSGKVPWNYVAAFLVRVAQPLEKASVVAIIETAEPVYLLLVDSEYHQVGERVMLPAGAGPLAMSFPLLPNANALVIQAGAGATGVPVTIHEAWLQTPGN